MLPDDVRGSLLLLTSEVVTNAVVHAGTAINVRAVVAADHVRVEVGDAEARVPVPRARSVEATSGRGLLLVEALSRSWGTERRADGKVVWFELAS